MCKIAKKGFGKILQLVHCIEYEVYDLCHIVVQEHGISFMQVAALRKFSNLFSCESAEVVTQPSVSSV
jgi:hypothetical protein